MRISFSFLSPGRLLLLCVLALTPTVQARVVDQVAAIVENSVITFSEVHWLAEYRNLPVPGDAQGRKSFYLDLVNQLVDQKIIAGEAEATPGIQVTPEEVENQVQAYRRRFPTEQEFLRQLDEMDMSLQALRDLFRRQLTVNEFVEVRFAPFVIILPDQIEEYYGQEFVSQLQEQGLPVPQLELVEESIRQILTERRINDELDRWLRNQRRKARVRIVLYRDPAFAPNLPETFLEQIQLGPVPHSEPGKKPADQ